MDFRTAQDDGLAFVYVLAHSTRAALVEHTRFAVARRPGDDPDGDAPNAAGEGGVDRVEPPAFGADNPGGSRDRHRPPHWRPVELS